MTRKEVIELFEDFTNFVHDKEETDDYLYVSKLVDDYLYNDKVRFKDLNEVNDYLEKVQE